VPVGESDDEERTHARAEATEAAEAAETTLGAVVEGREDAENEEEEEEEEAGGNVVLQLPLPWPFGGRRGSG